MKMEIVLVRVPEGSNTLKLGQLEDDSQVCLGLYGQGIEKP